MQREEFADWMSRIDVGFLQMMHRYWQLQREGMVHINFRLVGPKDTLAPVNVDGIIPKHKAPVGAPITDREFRLLLRELEEHGLTRLDHKS